MNKPNEKERVSSEIIHIMDTFRHLSPDEAIRYERRKYFIDEILNNKSLGIIADDQNMPPITDTADSSVWGIAFTQGMIEAYHQMGVHGWRKVVEIPYS